MSKGLWKTKQLVNDRYKAQLAFQERCMFHNEIELSKKLEQLNDEKET